MPWVATSRVVLHDGDVTAVDDVLADLAAEGDDLDLLLTGLDPEQWRMPTPSPGWTVADQVGHLASSDESTVLAVREPEAFAARQARMAASFESTMDAAAAQFAAAAEAELLATWRAGRAEVISALASVPAGERVPWVVVPLSPAAIASTRLMELIGHGQDIRDAVGAAWTPTDRIRHVAWLGVRTRDFAMANSGLAVPAAEFRVELTAPSGTLWTWGPEEAAQRVTGPAADFCLLVTRRRHRADLALRAEGAEAAGWLDVAQAYAGPPSAGRRPGQFAPPGQFTSSG
jgi:enediyne biosynthesis protein E11